MFVAVTSLLSVYASGGQYQLDWPKPNETLQYSSCGCADSCWTAEVRENKTNKVKSRLHCDCEKLTFSNMGSSEEIIADSCQKINDSNDKFEKIQNEMQFQVMKNNNTSNKIIDRAAQKTSSLQK
jgi:hypothetical protein